MVTVYSHQQKSEAEMARKVVVQTTCKLVGGPRDGQIIHTHLSKTPGQLEFFSPFIDATHRYVQAGTYQAGDYTICVYDYSGIRAKD